MKKAAFFCSLILLCICLWETLVPVAVAEQAAANTAVSVKMMGMSILGFFLVFVFAISSSVFVGLIIIHFSMCKGEKFELSDLLLPVAAAVAAIISLIVSIIYGHHHPEDQITKNLLIFGSAFIAIGIITVIISVKQEMKRFSSRTKTDQDDCQESDKDTVTHPKTNITPAPELTPPAVQKKKDPMEPVDSANHIMGSFKKCCELAYLISYLDGIPLSQRTKYLSDPCKITLSMATDTASVSLDWKTEYWSLDEQLEKKGYIFGENLSFIENTGRITYKKDFTDSKQEIDAILSKGSQGIMNEMENIAGYVFYKDLLKHPMHSEQSGSSTFTLYIHAEQET